MRPMMRQRMATSNTCHSWIPVAAAAESSVVAPGTVDDDEAEAPAAVSGALTR